METFEELVDYFKKYWLDEKEFVIMPNSVVGRMYADKLKECVSVSGILDNDKELSGKTYQGIPIWYAEEYLLEKKPEKILISSHYDEISKQLNLMGYTEYIDYIDIKKYEKLWFLLAKKQVHVQEVHIAVTTYCTLNCKHCNMWMNYYKDKNRKHFSLEELKKDFKLFFSKVDYCYNVVLLGGEPLLNRELKDLLIWLHENYREQYQKIQIISNATVLPETALLEVLQRVGVSISISDYTDTVPYKVKLNHFVSLLEQYQIDYVVNKELIWKNFYFPMEKQGAEFTNIREHMIECSPNFRGLNDGKFYFCHILWSADQAGLLKEEETDYLNLEEQIEKEQFVKFDLSYVKKGAVSLCKYCGGCGNDNKILIRAGEQS